MKLSFCALLFVASFAPALAAQSTEPYRVRLGYWHGNAWYRHSAESPWLAQLSEDCPYGVQHLCEGNVPYIWHHKATALSSPGLMTLEAYGLSWYPGAPGYGGLAQTEWYFDDVRFSYAGGNVPISVGVNLEILFAEKWGSLPPEYPDELSITIEWTNIATGVRYDNGPTWGPFGNHEGIMNLAPTGSWFQPWHLTTNTLYGLRVIVRKVCAAHGLTDRGSRTHITFAQTPFTISSANPTPGLRADSGAARIVDNSWNTPGPGAMPTLATSSPISTNQVEQIFIGGATPGTPGLLFIGLDTAYPGLVLGPWLSLDLLAPMALVGFVADGQGQSTLPVAVPPGTEGSVLALQAAWFLSPDPADWYGSAALVVRVVL